MVYIWVGIFAIIACFITAENAPSGYYLVFLGVYIIGLVFISRYRLRKRGQNALK